MTAPPPPQVRELRDGWLAYHPEFLAPRDADALRSALRDALPWQRDVVRMFGRQIEAPRLNLTFRVVHPRIEERCTSSPPGDDL